MNTIEKPRLQNRWQIKFPTPGQEDSPFLLYYGLRNYPLHREQTIPISRELAAALQLMDGQKAWPALHIPPGLESCLRQLEEKGVIVDNRDFRPLKSLDQRQTCVRCVIDDYVIPGLEFDDQGLCAFCQCYELETASGRSFVHTISEDQLQDLKSQKPAAQYDAMVMYTGGKDSSFLLWYLARRLGLRVLAAFWDMPYTSPAARANIDKARKHLPEVDFVVWTLGWDQVKQAMRGQLCDFGTPCLCPTAAFGIFYPLAFRQKIPAILFGMEDVQSAVLDYVFQRPGTAGHPPLSPRDQTLQFLTARALPRPLVEPVRWEQDLGNYHASINRQLSPIFAECREIIRQAGQHPEMPVPIITRLSTAGAYGSWQNVIDVLQKEMGWEMPEGQNSKLHTSCLIEPVKDYCQFRKFLEMRTVFFPQSLVELGASVYFGMTSREDALNSRDDLGFYEKPAVFEQMLADLGIESGKIGPADGELFYIINDRGI